MQRAIAAAVTLLLLSAPVGARAQARTADDPAAVRDFQQRLQAYLTLRQQLAATLPPLMPTPSGTELTARQTALAKGLQTARAAAKPGDLIPPAVAARIRAIVLADFNRRTAVEERATFSEVPNAPMPAINRLYPVEAALPTVPPLLLLNLPRLPDTLQYRFYGRHIVLLDGDLQVIVDYIENALPPR